MLYTAQEAEEDGIGIELIQQDTTFVFYHVEEQVDVLRQVA